MNQPPRASFVASRPAGLGAKPKPRGILSRALRACLGALGWAAAAAAGAPAPTDDLLDRAQHSFSEGRPQEALGFANQLIQQTTTNAQAYYVRGRIHDAIRQPEKALADFNRVLELEPRALEVYQHRGGVQFKLKRFAESIADFDRVLARFPREAPHHWQRGISCYYAGRYVDGRKQFELHQTVNSNDVENAVWHFLCLARSDGISAARERILPIAQDRRIPLMTIYAVYRGTAEPDEALRAARAGDPPPAELHQRLFYTHLYLGLYYDVKGTADKAREHMNLAATTYQVDHYMGDVARVHAETLKK